MFHGRCSTSRGRGCVRGGWGDPALADAGGEYRRWPQLALRGSAADRAAEAELDDRCASPTLAGELFEPGLGPAVAVVAVEAERMVVGDQVGDGVQVDGVHGCSVARPKLRG